MAKLNISHQYMEEFMSLNNTSLPDRIAAAASDKKARDIVILDLRGISTVTDYFVICSANSSTQVQAIADHVEEELTKQGSKALRREGYRDANWVLLDYGTCITHVFVESDRRFYDLERLWSEAQFRSYEQ